MPVSVSGMLLLEMVTGLPLGDSYQTSSLDEDLDQLVSQDRLTF